MTAGIPGPDLDENLVNRVMMTAYPDLHAQQKAAVRRDVRTILRAARRQGWKEPDWAQSPEVQEWFEDVRTGLVPKLQNSAATVSIVPKDGEPDAKYAVELGMSIMLEKPIILMVVPGAKVPDKLALIADEIISGDVNETTAKRVSAAVNRITGEDDDGDVQGEVRQG